MSSLGSWILRIVLALTLSPIAHAKVGQPKLLDVLLERLDLRTRVGFGDESADVFKVLSGSSTVCQLLTSTLPSTTFPSVELQQVDPQPTVTVLTGYCGPP